MKEISRSELDVVAGGFGDGVMEIFSFGLKGVSRGAEAMSGDDGGSGMFGPNWKYSEMMEREMAGDASDQMRWANSSAADSGYSGAEESYNAGSGGFADES